MRRVASALQLLLLTAALLAAASPATAQEEAPEGLADVAFVVSVDEPADAPAPQPVGGLDLMEVALGEPGDGTLVLRATLAEAPSGPVAMSRLYFGFTTPAGDVVGGCGYDGTPQVRNIGEAIAPDSCVLSGAVVYAIYAYETAELAVGGTVTKIWGFTDGCAQANDGCLPADTAPGGVGNQGWPATTFGTDYPLTGCTRASGCSLGAPLRVLKDANGTSVNETFVTPTNVTVQYNVTYPYASGRVAWDANVTAGSVNVTVIDAGNATVANLTVDASGNGTVDFEDALTGVWTVRLNFTGFQGRLNVTLELPPAPLPANTKTVTSSTGDDDRTGTFPLRRDDKGTPGAGVPLLLAGTAALAVLLRRRLA